LTLSGEVIVDVSKKSFSLQYFASPFVGALLATLSMAAACAMDTTGDDCTSILPFSIVAYVTDSVTGRPAAQGATLVAVDGAFTDSVVGAFSGSDATTRTDLALALQRPGTYIVTVRKPGYASWEQRAVALQFDRCGKPTPQRVFQARLSPS